MPRNYNSRYQYETSPRKIKPDYTPTIKKNPQQGKRTTTLSNKSSTKQKVKIKKKQSKTKVLMYVIAGFAVLFAISYRKAEIDENFTKVQDLKDELAVIEKENEQLEVSIERNLNLSNLEKQAKELLGMNKLTNKQTRYVNLPKNDHIESSAEKVIIEENKFSIKNTLNTISKLFK